MRWLKHLSCAHRDEKITELISECGLEGYGFFWLLCEVVAESMDKSDRCELTHPLPQWSHLLYSHHHRVSKYLGKLQVIGLCEVSNGDGNIRVAIPNLLKYRDEYASRVGTKSGQNRDNVPSKIEKHNTEAEDKHPLAPAAADEAEKLPKPVKEPTSTDLLIDDIADELATEHPKTRSCAAGVVVTRLKAIAKLFPPVDRVHELGEIRRRHRGWRESHDWTKDAGQYAKGLKAWLSPTDGLWKIEPPSPTLPGLVPIRSPGYMDKNAETMRIFGERMREKHGGV